jgi:hypothetical protein
VSSWIVALCLSVPESVAVLLSAQRQRKARASRSRRRSHRHERRPKRWVSRPPAAAGQPKGA